MEKNREFKKNLSLIPIKFIRSSYLESYTKKLNLMKSCKSVPVYTQKASTSEKILNLKSNNPFFQEGFLEKISDISSILPEKLDISYESELDELGNILKMPLSNKNNHQKRQSNNKAKARPNYLASPNQFVRKYSKNALKSNINTKRELLVDKINK